MEVIWTIVILYGIMALGIASAICALILATAVAKERKKSQARRSKKPARRSRKEKCLLWIAIGSAACGLIFGIWGSDVLLSHALPDQYYEYTDIVIEEDGYQDQRFTADGVVYEALPLVVNDVVCGERAKAVFTYKTAGFLNGYLTGNYYRIENDKGFTLIWNGADRLFAPVLEAEEILDYYYGESIQWLSYDYQNKAWNEDAQGVAINEEASAAMQAYLKLELSDLPTEVLVLDNYVTSDLNIAGESSDRIVQYSYWFIAINGKLYVEIDLTVNDTQQTETTLALLPDEISAPLLELMQ